MADVDDAARASLVANERAKARATYLNGLAVAVLAIGGLAPIATAAASAALPSIATLSVGLICLMLSYAPHSVAMWLLGMLTP